jgi:hypothetical protein
VAEFQDRFDLLLPARRQTRPLEVYSHELRERHHEVYPSDAQAFRNRRGTGFLLYVEQEMVDAAHDLRALIVGRDVDSGTKLRNRAVYLHALLGEPG